MSTRRPGPLRWVAYAYGAGLPERYHEWVLYDTTSRSWIWRHLARFSAQIAPIAAAILIFLPAPFWIRLTAVLGGTVMALVFSFAYLVETAEHRLVKAGYRAGTGEATRQERSRRERTESVQRRNERIAARRARR
jgi:hypothetical protein